MKGETGLHGVVVFELSAFVDNADYRLREKEKADGGRKCKEHCEAHGLA